MTQILLQKRKNNKIPYRINPIGYHLSPHITYLYSCHILTYIIQIYMQISGVVFILSFCASFDIVLSSTLGTSFELKLVLLQELIYTCWKIKLKKVKVQNHFIHYAKISVGRPHKSRSPSKKANPRASIAIYTTTVPRDAETEQPSIVTLVTITADSGNIVRIEVGNVAEICCRGSIFTAIR